MYGPVSICRCGIYVYAYKCIRYYVYHVKGWTVCNMHIMTSDVQEFLILVYHNKGEEE
jgi:hypothetical protein